MGNETRHAERCHTTSDSVIHAEAASQLVTREPNGDIGFIRLVWCAVTVPAVLLGAAALLAGFAGVATALAVVVLGTTALCVLGAQNSDKRYENQLYRNRAATAADLAYISNVRGKDITNRVVIWIQDNPVSHSVHDAASALETIVDDVGDARAHQLCVRADQQHDYGVFTRVLEAAEFYCFNTRRVVDAVLDTHGRIGSVTSIIEVSAGENY